MKNETLDVINSRRSIRAYKSDAIPRELLNAVLEAGTSAPTEMGRQSPVIIAVESKAYRDRVSKLNAAVLGSDTDPYYGAPVIILVLADSSRPTYVEDASCVLEKNDACRTFTRTRYCMGASRTRNIRQRNGKRLLAEWKLPESLRGVGSIAIGYPAVEPDARLPRKRRIHYSCLSDAAHAGMGSVRMLVRISNKRV